MISDLEISRHAAIQWMKRTGERDPEVLRQTWDAEIATVKEIQLEGVYRALALCNHGFKEARYFKSKHGWVFVVADKTIVTVHGGGAKRFNKHQ